MWAMTDHNPTLILLIRLLPSLTKPLSRVDLARALGVSACYVRRALCAARKRGLAVRLGGAGGTVWANPEVAAVVRAQMAARPPSPERVEREKARLAKRCKGGRNRKGLPVQIVRPAAVAPVVARRSPFYPMPDAPRLEIGPNSVFALGDSLR